MSISLSTLSSKFLKTLQFKPDIPPLDYTLYAVVICVMILKTGTGPEDDFQ